MINQMRKSFLIKTILINLLFNSIFVIGIIKLSYAQNNISKNELIRNINKIYNKYPIIKSRFKQENSSNNISYGWFIIDKKNGKARIEYDNIPLRIIVNNNSLMIEQIDLNEKTFTPLMVSPLKYIISNNTNIDNKNINITNITFNNNFYTLDVSSKKDSFKGYVTLIFNTNYYLTSWIIHDEVNNITKLTLLDTQYLNEKIPSNIFNTHRVKKLEFSKIH